MVVCALACAQSDVSLYLLLEHYLFNRRFPRLTAEIKEGGIGNAFTASFLPSSAVFGNANGNGVACSAASSSSSFFLSLVTSFLPSFLFLSW